MLFDAIKYSYLTHLIANKSNFFLNLIPFEFLFKLSGSFLVELKDLIVNTSLVVKTHSLYIEGLDENIRYLFVFGDPFESALSVLEQFDKKGFKWVNQHLLHLNSSDSIDNLFVADVLQYEAQLASWLDSSAYCVHYEDIWYLRESISRYLGFALILPVRRDRSIKKTYSGTIDWGLFEHLRLLEQHAKKACLQQHS